MTIANIMFEDWESGCSRRHVILIDNATMKHHSQMYANIVTELMLSSGGETFYLDMSFKNINEHIFHLIFLH